MYSTLLATCPPLTIGIPHRHGCQCRPKSLPALCCPPRRTSGDRCSSPTAGTQREARTSPLRPRSTGWRDRCPCRSRPWPGSAPTPQKPTSKRTSCWPSFARAAELMPECGGQLFYRALHHLQSRPNQTGERRRPPFGLSHATNPHSPHSFSLGRKYPRVENQCSTM